MLGEGERETFVQFRFEPRPGLGECTPVPRVGDGPAGIVCADSSWTTNVNVPDPT